MDEASPQLLDLNREWVQERDGEDISHRSSEEEKLELRLAPPGEGYGNSIGRDNSVLSLRHFSGSKRWFIDTVDTKTEENSWVMNNSGSQNQKFSLSSPWSSSIYQVKTQQQQRADSSFLQLQSNPQSLPVREKESSQPCSIKAVDLQITKAERKGFSPASANTAVPNSSQKRTAPTAVVGWPPIRSFRKNLAGSSSSKPNPATQNVAPSKVPTEKPVESCRNGFVKINMDGVPIGRKVDLKAYDSYEKLASAVDELFRAQRDYSAGGIQNKQEAGKAITGLLDGSGEYTLVYEDNEGDKILVGDVPWLMFVSTVKRLRVLKSSELPTLYSGIRQDKRSPLDVSLR